LMWLGDQITERGIGNGIAYHHDGIVARLAALAQRGRHSCHRLRPAQVRSIPRFSSL
jgi:preprotein translocase subunit SecY